LDETFRQEIMTKFLHISFFLFIFLTIQLFAQSINDKSTQLHLTENEKIWLTLHPVIKVGIDPDYATYEWVNENGKHNGVIVDYLNKLEDILGIRFELIKNKSWNALLNMAKKSQLDMLTSIVKTPERSEFLTFSEPYRHTPTIIIDNGKGSFIGSLKQLSGKKVSVEKGYFMEEFIKNNYPNIILVSVPNTKEALKMLACNEVDAYVGDANVVDYKIKTNDFNKLRFSGQTEYISHQGFGLSKGNEPLATILTKAIATIPKSETDAIFNHWLNIEKGIQTQIFIKYGLVTILLLLIIAYWIYILKREIQHRKEAEKKLRKSESLFRNLTENMIDVIWKLDKDFHFSYISPSVEKTLGYHPDKLIGHHVFEIFTVEGKNTAIKRMQQRQEDQKKGIYRSYSTLEIEHICKNGKLIWGEVLTKPELDKNKNIIGYHGISRVITERKKMEDKIRELAFYDPLTKLANRRLLYDRLKQAAASTKRSKKHSAIIYIDLDNFKPLNDKHGHAAGDLLLIEVAKRLKDCMREMDTVARVGGDEFTAIIHELHGDKEKSTREANVIAKKILSVLSKNYIFKNTDDSNLVIEHHCTASIGVLVFKAHSNQNKEKLFKLADEAMYQAKDAGRNTICFYDKDSV